MEAVTKGSIEMAGKTAIKAAAFVPEEQSNLAPAKLKRLIVKNFRCIGESPVEIDLDDIVVLVGANNAGKSTILRAYKVVMEHESLTTADFPCEIVDANKLPEIELQTYIDEETRDKPGEQWLHHETETGRHYVRERWTWSSPNLAPVRQGRVAASEEWSAKVPWGGTQRRKDKQTYATLRRCIRESRDASCRGH